MHPMHCPASRQRGLLSRNVSRYQRGVTSIEYALIGALIAVVIVGAVSNLGLSLGNLYDNVATQVGCAVSKNCG